MTYRYFKLQLYYSLLELKAAQQAELGILEKEIPQDDRTARKVIRTVNLAEYGKDDVVLREDVLYAIWEKGQYDSILYWPVRQLYDYYREEGWQGVLPLLESAINREDEENSGLLEGEEDTYTKHRQNLILRPLPFYRKREELRNCIYWRKGDIALVLYLVVYDAPDNLVSLKMDRCLTAKWRRKDAMLLTGALLNCFSRMPPRLFPGQDALSYYDEKGGVFMPGEDGVEIRIDSKDRIQGIIGYRLTTTRRINGAIALFYPGVRERLAELLDGDFFAGFTSVNEAVIHPVKFKKLSEMKRAVFHNNTMLGAENSLTNKIYRYFKGSREFAEV